MNTKRSEALFEEALQLMPGGVNSPVRAFGAVGGGPLFIDKAYKDRIVDVDGNEFIDFVCSWGPGILGHAHPRVIKAVQEAAVSGLSFGAPTEKESTLIKLVQEGYGFIEKMRLVSSGTEAVMSAVRVARGFTGRDKILKFDGCYHGHSDSVLFQAGSGLATFGIPGSAGIPESVQKDTLVAEFNDVESVKEVFEKYGKDIAVVIVEPAMANRGVTAPEKGFLEFLREITRNYGAVLIFDEVITGFRLSYGGASEYYGVTPDLVTLGKIIGGGMPLAGYGGRRDIMKNVSPEGKVYQAGTLSGNPIATAAGIETLRILKEDKAIYERQERKADKLEAALKTLPAKRVGRAGSLLSLSFETPEEYARFFRYMQGRGIYLPPSQFEAWFISDAHTDEDIEKTVRAIGEYR